MPSPTFRGTPTRPRAVGIALALAFALFLSVAHPAGVARSADLARPPGDTGEDAKCRISRILVPRCGLWWGAVSSPRGSESYDQALMDFEARTGRTVDIAHYYMRGDTVMFPTNGQLYRANEPGRERLLLINWKPDTTWRAAVEGAYDGYLRSVAEHIKANYDVPFFLTLHCEMERYVNLDPASGMTPDDFRRFFQHTIDVLRDNGATKVIPIVCYSGGAPHWGDVPWYDDLYPGDRYVDWIAEDTYAFGPPGDEVWRSDMGGMIDRVQDPSGEWPGFYSWAVREHPSKPIMIAEWGVDDVDDDASYKPTFFNDALAQLESYPQVKALVYWDDYWDPMVGETRVDSSTATLREVKGFVHTRAMTRPGEVYLDRPAVPE